MARFSAKRLAIDKTNARLVLIVGISAFITVFCLITSKTLLDQRAYQSKVSSQKETALGQLRSNIDAVDQLEASYREFAGAPENILGGDPDGEGDRDGDNPRIILDALPGKYDFPALTTSIEKLLKQGNYTMTGITGTDDEIVQSEAGEAITPVPVEMPFSVEVKIPATSGGPLMQLFERSIRPMPVQKLIIVGEEDTLNMTIEAKTYFQPSKSLNVKEEVVK
jgi:hypothetical protein